VKLLLHLCCGPCFVYPADFLKSQNIYFEGLFYNPNIHPIDEFNRRKENAIKASIEKDIKLHIENDFDQDRWENFLGDTLERCQMCYDVRLFQTAKHAYNNGFDAFTTSLLVSPYQNHHLIKKLGESYASLFNIEFFYKDFREGFRQGQTQAKDMCLYRQKYCGCIKSIKS
jgi:predicted adenine nucleotide alpha hydrolase (AANH) superfamily ATPase